VDAGGIERWLIGHACELATAGIDPVSLRYRTRIAGPALREASDAFIAQWLAGLQ
jgi:GMP synthase (glutamine-hydrolysing)